ncbi:DUF4232 domain-containing protein [Kitasatospora sp. NPDC091335]|uniref:DUF4232 domain-containing protein n=1 Tax=Kitasatospora sp. NPDC091335 TaxID=3364085 RepID=UPI00382C9242
MRQFSVPRRQPAASCLAATAALLLVGCGTVTAAGSGGGAEASGTPGACATPTPTPTATTPGVAQPTGLAQGGVRITVSGPGCAEYEVTNPNGEPYDYTVLFSLRSAQGEVLDNLSRTVTALAPGATEKGRIDLGGPSRTPEPGPPPTLTLPGTRTSTAKPEIAKVRGVPTAEAPNSGGPCPTSGVRLYADEGDAAMGLRVVGLHLRNCGTTPVTLDGYPQVQPLDLDHRPLGGVSVLRGGAGIATGTGADDPPRKFALLPGEGARTTLVWRNTTEAGLGEPLNAPYVRVRATPDAAPVMVTPELDLGTTGRLGAGAWTREDADTRSPSSAPRP